MHEAQYPNKPSIVTNHEINFPRLAKVRVLVQKTMAAMSAVQRTTQAHTKTHAQTHTHTHTHAATYIVQLSVGQWDKTLSRWSTIAGPEKRRHKSQNVWNSNKLD